MCLSTNPNCRRQAARESDTAVQALEGKMALLEAAGEIMRRRRGLMARSAGRINPQALRKQRPRRRRPRRRGIDVDAIEARLADWRRRWNSARYVVVMVGRLRVAQNWSSD